MIICIRVLKYTFCIYLRTCNLFIVIWLHTYIYAVEGSVYNEDQFFSEQEVELKTTILFSVRDMSSMLSEQSLLNCDISGLPSMYIKFSDCVDINHCTFLQLSKFFTVVLGSPVRMLVKSFPTPYEQW
jgi:hypothetical protein